MIETLRIAKSICQGSIHLNITDDNKMYGIWLKGKGWLRGKDDVISFSDYSFAMEVSGIIHAKVRRIDESWKDLEVHYLEQETKGQSLWHIFKNSSQPNNNK